MYIPKNKMMVITAAIQAALATPWAGCLMEDEIELLNQVQDKAALVQNGDANFLMVEQYYGHNPEKGI